MRWLSPPESVPEDRDSVRYLQADVIQEFQPVANFLQDARRDFGLLLR